MQTKSHPHAGDHAIADLATRQGGVVAHQQLRALGLGAGAMEHRVAVGRLRPVAGHRAVYAVGHSSRTPRTRLWAAFLAVGEQAVISHRSAAARLIVETDGDAAHGRPRAIAHDARRDAALQLAGWCVMRFPRIELMRDPRYLADAIRTALGRG